VTATEIDHYPGPSRSTPSWTGELSANYTRYIPAISGGLGAIQHNVETPVLQLTNLHGDVIATATDSETSTKLASTVAEASEYGVPATEAPPKYSWLGSHQLPTTLPSGTIAMGARSYIPQLGRFLQDDPIPGGSANAYAYTYGDPVNAFDPTGAYTIGGPSQALIGYANETSVQASEEQAAINAAVRAEAERKAAEAAAQAAAYAGFETEGPEEEWGEEDEEEEEWAEQYASWRHGGGIERATPQSEEGLLYQPIEEEAHSQQRQREMSTLAALCRTELSGRTKGTPRGACARYVSIFGKIWHAIKHAWHVIVHGAKHVYETLHQLYWSARAWYNLNVGPVLQHWECVADGASIGLLAGIGTAAAGPWASGYISTGAGVATSEVCERA
jgi:RHS repeat-associated protein